ncbi:uncharacterized protein CcaverHIS019_0104460 [Cutaneotrichosporon cavernicola]|uniref:SUZ domain-containing protein n=1 Tax=Cutaneotrichosporon cavernicola TaxID=279322 RepID=A0AA48L1Y8_9TREE|nr:uncharacterized protein CcaverHIS019_0104460 [Cutaneotrichosporon cavernicola]BEI87728.1 hypothetical protein CcaverHIS019_0104460 [Cutaneotrichosporon cavernicola]
MDDWDTDDFEPKRVLRAGDMASASTSAPSAVLANVTAPPPTSSGLPLSAPTPEGIGARPILLARRPTAPSPSHPQHPAHLAQLVQHVPPPETPPEDDDEWFRGVPASNRQIWDSANRPAIQMTAASAPPPKLQILKRDAPPRPTSGSSSGTATPKTLAQREEEYRLARERIFGKEKDEVPSSSASTSSTTSAEPTPCERGNSGSEFDRGFDKLDARRYAGQAYGRQYSYSQTYQTPTYQSQTYQSQSYQSYQAQGQGYRYSAYEAQTFGPRYAPPQQQPQQQPHQHAPRPQPYQYYNAQYVPAPHAPSAHSQALPPQNAQAVPHVTGQSQAPHAYTPQAQNTPPYAYDSGHTPPMASTATRPNPPVPPIQQRGIGGGGVLRQPRGPGQGGFGKPP